LVDRHWEHGLEVSGIRTGRMAVNALKTRALEEGHVLDALDPSGEAIEIELRQLTQWEGLGALVGNWLGVRGRNSQLSNHRGLT